MPLIKSPSKKALQKNIETEMKANPDPSKRSQNIAIAYSTQRQAMKRKRKMAEGGEISAADESRPSPGEKDHKEMEMLHGASKKHSSEVNFHDEHKADIDDAEDEREMDMYAQGGEINFHDERRTSIDDAEDERDEHMLRGKPTRHASELSADDEHYVSEDDKDSMEMMMLAKGGIAEAIRKKKMMAEGGQVDLQHNDDEDLNNEDDMSFEAARKHAYFDLDDQAEDQPEDSNEHGDELSDEDSHDMVGAIRRKMKSGRR